MPPYFFILFLIFLSAFLSFTRADSQDAGTLSDISLESDASDGWKELFSLLHTANIADEMQEASFTIPPMSNVHGVQPNAQMSQGSTDSRPEMIQHSLEALLSEEAGRIFRSFESVINNSVALSMMFHDILRSASADSVPPSIAPFIPLLKDIAKLIATARDDLSTRFPLPATAPGHTRRAKRAAQALERLQRLLVRLAKNHDIEHEAIERHLDRVKPFLREAGVLVGDMAELYPAAIEALVLNLSAVLLPEALFLRSLVILYCFGPYVLGKDAISGWLVKHVSEVLRV